ncbi:LuxR C-terminal-related transcriptional regulator [Nocardia anaemiae]|uniref:LuxR C-terminal-related transcriptional regulator n=1 Tax=Nocardia anaemiae TaxID=263910 RepID=UPI0012F4B251
MRLGRFTFEKRRLDAVADLVADGCNNGAIANRVSVSKYTVNQHVSKILAKVELRLSHTIRRSPHESAAWHQETDTLAI